MKKIADIISENLFVNAYNICKDYSEKENLTDINLMLLRNAFKSSTENNIKSYYKNFIQTELFYGVPYLFSADVVTIPKNINGLREYRFFSMMSMILYNAIGLVFADICLDTISNVKFSNNGIFHYSPTKFNYNEREWKAKNEYSKYYSEYTKKIKDNIEIGDIVLKLDISKYFDTMDHEKLIQLLKILGLESKLAKYDIDEKARNTLLFYFESLMNQKHGIPQGKVNCVSDLFGFLYLLPFDLEVINLCKDCSLEFKAMIRYVDDIIIVFNKAKDFSNSRIFKELSKVEQKISLFFNDELMLRLNENKTAYYIIDDYETRSKFIIENTKKVSGVNKFNDKDKQEEKENSISEKVDEFIKVIKKYKFSNNNSFEFHITDTEKEKLKIVFEKNIKNYLKKEDIITELRKIVSSLDIELAVNQMYILIAFFFISKKNNDKPYLDLLVEYILNNLNIKDKRIIHIILLMITQGINFEKYDIFKSFIKENQSELIKDSYGKYILVFTNLLKKENKIELLENDAFLYQINYEYYRKSKYIRNYLFENITLYNRVILDIVSSNPEKNNSIVNQIKDYVYNVRNRNWDSAFNHFQNIFHEICKEKYNLKDDASINDIINKLYHDNIIENKDEIMLRKFYDRRNINPVSHPSKNGIASIKISRDSLEEFKDNILYIAINILEIE